MSAESWEACLLGAGAVLTAAEALSAGEASAAFCAVRPPGHHATRNQAMGFCLVNNVAVTAAALAEQGERVLIVDYDAHHGNGTQDIFYEHPTRLLRLVPPVAAVPGYRSDGGAWRRRPGSAAISTFPCRPGPRATSTWRPSTGSWPRWPSSSSPRWLIISAGFDAHRRDPLTDLGLTSADYALDDRRG